MPRSLGAPRARLAWRLVGFVTNHHEYCGLLIVMCSVVSRKEDIVKQSLVGMSLMVGAVLTVMVAAGCVGKGQTHVLGFQTKPPATQPSNMEPVKIVIEPFE